MTFTVNTDLTIAGNIDLQTNKITNIGAPTGANDVATKDYVDTEVAINSSSLFTEDAARNIVGGINAGISLIAGSVDNYAAGNNAGASITTGDENILIGSRAGTSISNALQNIAIGVDALTTNATSHTNIAIGSNSLQSLASGSGRNIAIGGNTGAAISTGEDNVAVGVNSLGAVTTGLTNTALGSLAGVNANSSSTGNLFLGNSSGPTVLGVLSDKLYIHNTVSDTPLIHGDFVTGNVTINGNLAVTGSSPTGVMGSDGSSNIFAPQSIGDNLFNGKHNVLIGAGAGKVTSGDQNTIVGSSTGFRLLTGSQNVMVGTAAGQWAAAASSGNVFLGPQSGPASPLSTVSSKLYIHNSETNTPLIHGDFTSGIVTINGDLVVTGTAPGGGGAFVEDINKNLIGGATAGVGLTSGIDNFLAGDRTGESISSGDHNISVGGFSLLLNNGHGNTTIGYSAAQQALGSKNTALGSLSMWQINGGNENTSVGYEAGALHSGTCGGNVFLGHRAGSSGIVNNQLFIHNDNSSSPLIHGDFSTGNVTINGNLTVTGTSPGSDGEANTVSNVGVAGVGLFKQKTISDLEFKNLNAGSNKISITDDALQSEVDIDVVEANIGHGNISGIGTNTHDQIDTHIADTANPHGTSIVNLTDSTIVTPADGHVLTFNTTSGKWINAAPTADSGAFVVIEANNIVAGAGAGAALDVNSIHNFLAGDGAGASLTSFSNDHNIAIGQQSLTLSTGQKNIALGGLAMSGATTADQNISIGYAVGNNITTGDRNVLIGDQAGTNLIDDSSGNICIGFYTGPSTSTVQTNMLYIGKDNANSVGQILIEGNMNPGSESVTVNGDFIVASPTVPASATDTGITGQIAYDASFIYVCTATNVWVRSPLVTW